MKTKILRGDDAPFMNKELKKAIYGGSRMKNRFDKDPCNESKVKFKKQRNKCVKLRRNAIKDHFKKATGKGIMSNKEFWDLVKPYLSNGGGLIRQQYNTYKRSENHHRRANFVSAFQLSLYQHCAIFKW